MFRRGGQTTAINSATHRILQTAFPDGTQLHEEYSLASQKLSLRKIRRKTALGKQLAWEYLYGTASNHDDDDVRENVNNPVCVREDGPRHFHWRIRQLWYSPEVFSVSVDHNEQCIIIRTSNCKYYKRLTIPEMHLCGLRLDEASLSWKHEMSTLVISYKKPARILAEEEREREEIKREIRNDVDCKQQ